MFDSVLSFLSYVLVVSVAAERLTELIKKFFIKDKEINTGWYMLISAIGGGFIATISPPETVPFTLKYFWTTPVIIGIIVSGGSGFWHEVVSVLSTFKSTLKQNGT